VPRVTRRQALELGASAAALAALEPGRALAASTAGSFSLALPSPAGAFAAAGGWQTTPVFQAPRRFDLIGLGWTRSSRAQAQVRARRRGGEWTPWTALHRSGDHGPDAGGGAAGTDPAWTGAADEFQLRLKGRVLGLRGRFVHSAPDARAARRRGVLASVLRRRSTGAPPIIPRAAWGGDSVTPRSGPSYGQVQLAFVHHTVNANDYGPEDSAAIVLGIARYHRDHNGWNDIGYNFLVDQYGQIFEGRAGGIEQAIVGAQTQGFNSVSTGIACIGTFTTTAPPAAALDALAQLIGWKLTLHAVPVSGTVAVTSSSGASATFQRVSGHRDGNATACPGDVLYGLLPDLRIRAAQYAGPVAGITVRAAATTLRGVTSASLSGTLRFADGSSPAGAPVEILYAASGSVYTVIAAVRCAADGQWSTTIDLPRTGNIRARFPGDATRAPLESRALAITVVPRLALAVSARTIRRRRRIAVGGVVAPASARHVVVAVERKQRGGYRTVRRRRTRLRDGRYLTFVRLRRRGFYRVTVSLPGATAQRFVRVTR
jgi:hypothetical protein